MAIVENQNGKFYIPDEIANDPTKTVAEITANAVPYELYLAQQIVGTLTQELNELNEQPDEISVPNPEKERIPELQQELEQAQEALQTVQSKYND